MPRKPRIPKYCLHKPVAGLASSSTASISGWASTVPRKATNATAPSLPSWQWLQRSRRLAHARSLPANQSLSRSWRSPIGSMPRSTTGVVRGQEGGHFNGYLGAALAVGLPRLKLSDRRTPGLTVRHE